MTPEELERAIKQVEEMRFVAVPSDFHLDGEWEVWDSEGSTTYIATVIDRHWAESIVNLLNQGISGRES